MPKLIDLTGQRFGRLIVIERDFEYPIIHNLKNPRPHWKCKCDCGNTITVLGSSLKNGTTKSCGCFRKETAVANTRKDLTGKKFGKLTVIKDTGKKYLNNTIWLCQCECGNLCEIRSASLIQRHTNSCGCLKSWGEANISKILQENNIPFIKEYSFSDLRVESGALLRYDFYLPKQKRLIEFDGEQHFKAVQGGWEAKDNFSKRQQRDKMKNEYALYHNIPLVRIPYWERDNITLEMILEDKYLIK